VAVRSNMFFYLFGFAWLCVPGTACVESEQLMIGEWFAAGETINVVADSLHMVHPYPSSTFI